MSVRLVLFGPPGAGKGTQAARICDRLGVPAISTGDIFRSNIKGGTALGRRVVEYTSVGALVPDELTDEVLRDTGGHRSILPCTPVSRRSSGSGTGAGGTRH